jgi:RimJ/RimL family protein N-acetyltransferase
VLLTCRFGFEELGLHRIYARVLPFNQPALKLFESCNFVREGEERESFFTWGRWWSPVCFSVLAQEFFKKFPDETAQE